MHASSCDGFANRHYIHLESVKLVGVRNGKKTNNTRRQSSIWGDLPSLPLFALRSPPPLMSDYQAYSVRVDAVETKSDGKGSFTVRNLALTEE